MDRLSEIRARCEAATPGPWWWSWSDLNLAIWGGARDCNAATGKQIVVDGDEDLAIQPENAEFICNAREDIPYLLSEIERLKQANKIAEAAWDGCALDAAEAQIAALTARAKKAEAELCQCCRAFSDATGHGWDENCEVCKFGPLPEPPKGV